MDGKRVPPGWRLTKFSGVAEVNPPRPLKHGQKAPFVEMAALPEHSPRIAYVTERQPNGGGARFQNGDTLFARITPCVENGKIGFVDFLAPGQVGFGSTEFIVLGPRDGSCDPKFIYFLARSGNVRSTAIARMTGTSGRQRVPLSVFQEELDVLLPPLHEQRKIAEILSTVNDAIERTEGVIQQVQVVKRGLMQQLLTRGIPGRHTRFKRTEVGEKPADWQVVKLGDVAEVVSGFAIGPSRRPGSNRKRYLTVANVQAGYVHLGEPRFMEVTPTEYKNRQIMAGDILVVEGHAQISELGRAAIAPSEVEGYTFQNHLFRVRVNPKFCDPTFLCTFINGPRGRAYFRSFGGTSSGLNTVSTTNVQGMPVPLPPVTEQRAISQALQAVEDQVAAEREANRQRREVKDALMQVLLTGEIRVKVEE